MRLLFITCLFIFGLINTNAFAQLRINEVVSSNFSSFLDEDGESPDWIELYNESNEWLNLRGFGLSDDVNRIPLWRFQKGSVPPKGYVLVFASGKNRQMEQKFWHSVVSRESSMNYIVPSQSVNQTWIQRGFDDSAWLEGRFGIGYGDEDDETEVPSGTISVFTRTHFTIENSGAVTNMKFHIDFDDAYVAYLNGVEIHRQNILGNSPLPFDALATTYTEPRLVFGQTLPEIPLQNFTDLLVEGDNVLAIQIHNHNRESSDLTLIPFLSVEFSEQPNFETLVAEETRLQSSGEQFAHTNFSLSSTGESIFVSSPFDVPIDSVYFPNLGSDESYGKIQNEEDWAIFPNPTPLAVNTGDSYSERLPKPILSHESGFYDSAVLISINPPTDAWDVRYTTDGSVPTISSPRFGQSPRIVDRTSIWRFRTIKNGALSSEVVTKTFLIGEETTLPVLSIGADPIDLWSDERGIYVAGTNGIPGNCMDSPVNWNQDWEIPVHIEFFESSGDLGFSLPAGAKIFGGCSRNAPQKSLSFFFRGRYGAPELAYPLFPETGIETYQSFVLRNSGNDFNFTQFRDGMMTQLLKDEDLESQAFKPVVVFINGEYWGIQNIREKVNEHFIASHSGAEAENIDILERGGDIVEGSNDHYRKFLNFIAVNNISDSLVFAQVGEYIDIDNFVTYYAAQIYFANTDWPGNNIKFWRDNSVNGKWRWIVYDTDFGFSLFGNNAWHNTLAFAQEPNGPDWPNPPWSTYVFRKLMENDVFRDKFVNRMADFMNTVFQQNHVLGKIDSLKGIIEAEMPKHFSRWGGGMNQWDFNISQMEFFARNRPIMMRSMLRAEFGLSTPIHTEINVSGVERGFVRVNSQLPSIYPFSGEYYPEVKVALTAIPKPGYEFEGWTGDVESGSEYLEIEAGMSVLANFKESQNTRSSLVVHEIMYNPDEKVNTGDWIEFYNNSGQSLDVSFWQIRDSVDSNVFTFPLGTVFEPEEYVVVARDAISFEKIYGIKPYFRELPFGLGGRTDQVRVFNEFGHLADSVSYSDRNPWPLDSDGTGKSIVLRNPSLDNSDPKNWSSSKGRGGNPGKENDAVIPFGTDMDPAVVVVSQNYPNPFRGQTSISVELSHRSTVDLEVYDMLGRRVFEQRSVLMEQGISTLRWSAGQFSSGVYIFRVVAGRFSEIKKMTVIR